MIKIKSGYLLEMNEYHYGIEDDEKPIFYIVIKLNNGLNLFEIESFYDETEKMCFKLSNWLCRVDELNKKEIIKVYGLCNNGRLTDVRNRPLLWENKEVFA